MMRARIIAQGELFLNFYRVNLTRDIFLFIGFTVVALMVGVAVSFNQKPEKKQ